MRLAGDGLRNEIAAHQPENVPVAGVAACHPEAVPTRMRAKDRHQVEYEPEHARPAVGDRGLPTEQRLGEAVERALDPLGRRLLGGEL